MPGFELRAKVWRPGMGPRRRARKADERQKFRSWTRLIIHPLHKGNCAKVWLSSIPKGGCEALACAVSTSDFHCDLHDTVNSARFRWYWQLASGVRFAPDGMSRKHWGNPFISGGIWRNTAVSAGLQAHWKTPFKQEARQAANSALKFLYGNGNTSSKEFAGGDA